MLAYIPAPWILWVMIILNCLTPTEHWALKKTRYPWPWAYLHKPRFRPGTPAPGLQQPTFWLQHRDLRRLIDEATMHGQESARSQLAVILQFDIAQFLSLKQYIPRCSMYSIYYSIFTYIWLIYGVNIGKYSIHGGYRICWWLNVNLIEVVRRIL